MKAMPEDQRASKFVVAKLKETWSQTSDDVKEPWEAMAKQHAERFKREKAEEDAAFAKTKKNAAGAGSPMPKKAKAAKQAQSPASALALAAAASSTDPSA